MKDLFTGIYNHFQTTSATSFYNGVSGQLFLEYAPEGTQFPYAVYSLDSNVHDWQFNTDYEESLITFHLFANDETEVLDLEKKLRDAYDEASFTVSDHSLLKFRFDNEWINVHPDMIPNEDIWQYTIQYRSLVRSDT